ncbi:hypothetical protein R1CP_20105 [Rhodococcus opacus]|uniref:Copper(I)-binding protein n=1 Tax=Rhodococcus opacus TaxID=37919 RepID=A0A1B1K804_RHOOP|nr:hypothetical protein [Rhodococcus opacus]ANS28701.1 hypothetical protein R1CP_20105 [Rhodococcus opacus]
MATPSHHHHHARLCAAIAAAVSLSAAGCGAGQQTQTSSEVAAVNGSNVESGAIALRNVFLDVDPAEPNGVELVFTAINTSDLQPDRLRSITSETAIVTLTAPPGALDLAPGTAVAAGAPIEQLDVRAAPDQPITAAVSLDTAIRPGLTTSFLFHFDRAGAIEVKVPFDVVPPGEPVPAGRHALPDPV